MFSILLISIFVTSRAYEWSETDANRMVRYSYAAYCGRESILSWDCTFCDSKTKGFKTALYSYDPPTDTAVFVGYNEILKELIVSFRGTQPYNLKDWLVDLDAFKLDYPIFNITGAMVHKGFYNAYSKHNEAVVASLLGLMVEYPGFTVYLTGHSLGASLALLLAMDLYYNKASEVFKNATDIRMVTFGSPRTGNKEFADAFSRIKDTVQLYRVTHANDVVPHLPLRSMGFTHVATEVWERKSRYTVCDGSGEDPRCSDSNILDVSVTDHLSYMNLPFFDCWSIV